MSRSVLEAATKVPFVDLTAVNEPIAGNLLRAIADLVDSGQFVNGHAISSLTLALGQTVTIDYSIVVTRTCPDPTIVPHPLEATVDVVDQFDSNPETVLAFHLDHSTTFSDHRTVTAHDCGSFDVTNTATVRDGTDLAHSTVDIPVTVDCNHGCTLTLGYWKTHSAQGPAPFDDNWNNAPNVYPGAPSGLAEQTPFYFSGQTWYKVFWTPPAGGNAYYILAHQYMAAVLNILNGASSTSAVNSALTAATAYFNNVANTPSSALSLTKSARNTLLGYATTLGNYNTGLIGPGHCTEDGTSDSATS